ncbi:hypothetical protein TNCV_2468461 [Trichonephila clavipes]|nr:hypothetical protein TNCV_2468461 [Trichonephila clavipes]
MLESLPKPGDDTLGDSKFLGYFQLGDKNCTYLKYQGNEIEEKELAVLENDEISNIGKLYDTWCELLVYRNDDVIKEVWRGANHCRWPNDGYD